MRISKFSLKGTIICQILLLCGVSFSQSTYYVDSTGNNTNSGSIDNPWKTIQYGIEHISGGDTLIVNEGIYYEDSGIRINKEMTPNINGTENQPTTIKARGKVYIVVDKEVSPGIYIKGENGNFLRYLVIDGFFIESQLCVEYAKNCVFENNTCSLRFRNFRHFQTGIMLNSCYNCEVRKNNCSYIKGGNLYVSGIGLINSSKNKISENICNNNMSFEGSYNGIGILLYDESNENIVDGNFCNGNSQSGRGAGGVGFGVGIYIYNSHYNVISNNHIEGNKTFGIFSLPVNNDTTVIGTIIKNNYMANPISLVGPVNNKIYNNIIKGGINIGPHCPWFPNPKTQYPSPIMNTIRIKNNVFLNSSGINIGSGIRASNLSVINNIFDSVSPTVTINTPIKGFLTIGYNATKCAGKISNLDNEGMVNNLKNVDPLFRDPASDNFRLLPQSPCLGCGLLGDQMGIYGGDCAPVDSDCDGITDSWEDSHGLNKFLADDNADNDNDGLSNFREYIFNIDPNNSDSDNDGLPDKFELDRMATPYSPAPTNPACFDTDADMLSDYNEIYVYNTDPISGDIDGDNLGDGLEILFYQTDVRKSDTDNDEKSDADEVFGISSANLQWYYTNPLIADNDNDGVTDGKEAKLGTNPLIIDTDNDTSPDKEEIDNQTNPKDPVSNIYNINAVTINPLPDDTVCTFDFILSGSVNNISGKNLPVVKVECQFGSACWKLPTGYTDWLEARITGGLGTSSVQWSINIISSIPHYFHQPPYSQFGRNMRFIPEGIHSIKVRAYDVLGNMTMEKAYDISVADNLSDEEESLYGTNPMFTDTDGDFLIDGDEVKTYGTNPLLLDTDNDGMNDKWEISYGLNPLAGNDADNDTDNDGISNLYEHNNDSNPTLSDSDCDGLPDFMEITVYKTYPSKADSDADGLTDYEELNLCNTNPLNPDTDGDLVTDGDEVKDYASNPNNTDSDNDGMNDKWEVDQKTNPAVNDSNDDLDCDGLTNIEERDAGTCAFLTDTDNDGISDPQEINVYHTNPKKTDSDRDGLTDYEEIMVYHTNPNSIDTDNDFMPDLLEIMNNLNPLLKDSSLDPDCDGLINKRELLYNTDPYKPDTDDDGLNDNDEANLSSNPLKSDSDSDGLNDGEEAHIYHTNPMRSDTDSDGINDFYETNVYHTNAVLSDTDNDGLADYAEIKTYSSNPLACDSDNDGISDNNEINIHKTDPYYNDTDDDGIPDIESAYLTSPVNPDTDNDRFFDYEEILAGTQPGNPDTDNDGIPDGWETANGLNPLHADSQNDPDNEGLKNIDEFIFNTNPFIPDTDNDQLSDYEETKVHSTNPLVADTDSDCIDDYTEINVYFTNPLKSDSDNDGIKDLYEINTLKTDPNVADTDSDKITDRDELQYLHEWDCRSIHYILYTDPLNPDTDNDGLIDGDETLTYNTDPLKLDTDNDKLKDGEEVNIYHTDPANPDTDNDGVIDGDEVEMGTNPLSPYNIIRDFEIIETRYSGNHIFNIESNGTNYLSTWSINNSGKLNLTLYTPSGCKIGKSKSIDIGEFNYSLATNGNSYWLSWTEHTGDGYVLKGAIISGNDASVLSQFIIKSTSNPADIAKYTVSHIGLNYLFCREGSGDQDNDGIFARLIDESGNMIGPETLVNSQTAGIQNNVCISATGDKCVIAWETNDNDGRGISAKIIGADNDGIDNDGIVLLSNDIPVNSRTIGNQQYPKTAFNGSNIAILWENKEDISIYGQMFDFYGNKIADEFSIDAQTQGIADIDYYKDVISTLSEGSMRVTPCGSDYYVSWVERESQFIIYSKIISSSGESMGDKKLITFGTGYLLHHTQDQITNNWNDILLTWKTAYWYEMKFAIMDSNNNNIPLSMPAWPHEYNYYNNYDFASDGNTFCLARDYLASSDNKPILMFFLSRQSADDPEGDGVDNQTETQYGSDPKKSDSDEDSLSDYDEIYVFHTNPVKPDSDNDGLLDPDELANETNPNLADTDNDTISDGDELNQYHTNPLKPDTDGDQISDPVEINYQLDPNSKYLVLSRQILFNRFCDGNGNWMENFAIQSNGETYLAGFKCWESDKITFKLLSSFGSQTDKIIHLNTLSSDFKISSNGENYLVSWMEHNNDSYGLKGIIVSGQGEIIRSDFIIGTYSYPANRSSWVVSNLGSYYVVAWEGSSTLDNDGIFAQLIDENGNKTGTEFIINSGISGNQSNLYISNNNNNCLITWESDNDSGIKTINGSILQMDNEGQLLKSQTDIFIKSVANGNPLDIATCSNGYNYIVLWASSGDTLIYGQIIDFNGTKTGNEFRISAFSKAEMYYFNDGFLDYSSIKVTSSGHNYCISWFESASGGWWFYLYNIVVSDNGIVSDGKNLITYSTCLNGVGEQLTGYSGDNIRIWSQSMYGFVKYSLLDVNNNTSTPVSANIIDTYDQYQFSASSNGLSFGCVIRSIPHTYFALLSPQTPDDIDADGLTLAEETSYGTNPAKYDTDNDGIVDFDEIFVFGLDPLNNDSDGDGMYDGWEIMNKLDPHQNDAGNDPDNDGLNNAGEFQFKTCPYFPDSDNDGMPDEFEARNNLDPLSDDTAGDADDDSLDNLQEYKHGSSPRNPDTDGDYLKDGEEIYIYSTNLLNPDTDGDGHKDGEEVYAGFDPKDPDSVFGIIRYGCEDGYFSITWTVSAETSVQRTYKIFWKDLLTDSEWHEVNYTSLENDITKNPDNTWTWKYSGEDPDLRDMDPPNPRAIIYKITVEKN